MIIIRAIKQRPHQTVRRGVGHEIREGITFRVWLLVEAELMIPQKMKMVEILFFHAPHINWICFNESRNLHGFYQCYGLGSFGVANETENRVNGEWLWVEVEVEDRDAEPVSQ